MKRLPFSDPMYLAFLKDLKTQTRRTGGLEDVNSYPGTLEGKGTMGELGYKGLCPSDYYLKPSLKASYKKNPGLYHYFMGEHNREINPIIVKAAYQVGEIVAVTAAIYRGADQNVYYGEADRILYRADDTLASGITWPWMNVDILPARYCPVWCSQHTAQITGVRAERLQDISEQDARNEGIYLTTGGFSCGRYEVYTGKRYVENTEARNVYISLWHDLNENRKGYSWEDNKYVFVYEFKRVS